MLGYASDSYKDWGRKLAVGPDGSTAIAGYTYQNIDLGGGPIGTSSYVYLAKYAANGAHQWSFRIPTAVMDNVVAIVSDGLGNIYVAGQNGVNYATTFYDVAIAKYSPDGTLLWT